MIVGGAGRPQERRPAGNLGADLEAERPGIEVNGAGQVVDVEHCVVEAANGHGDLPGLTFCYRECAAGQPDSRGAGTAAPSPTPSMIAKDPGLYWALGQC